MSTASSVPPEDDIPAPADPAASATATEPLPAPVQPAVSLPRWRRITGRVLAVLLALAVAAGATGLGVWETTRDSARGVARIPARPTTVPPPADPVPLTERLDPRFLTDPTVTHSYSGLTLTGTVPPNALATEESTRALAAHLNSLTRASCADNIALRTPDNLHIRLWGFCFGAAADEDLAELLFYAHTSAAAQVVVTDHPAHGTEEKRAVIRWLPTTAADYDDMLDSWETLRLPPSLRNLELTAYGVGKAEGHMANAHITPTGISWRTDVTEMTGLPEPKE